MNRTILIIIVVLILLVVAFAAVRYGGFGAPADKEPTQTAAESAQESLPAVRDNSRVIVDARVTPREQADLSFAANGRVDQLLVDEGESVEPGQVLARLDASQQQTAVSRTRADLQRAQAQYDQLVAGARSEEIDTARAVLAAAQARLSRVQEGSLPGETAAATAGLNSAQASLQKLLEGATEQELIEARAALANAEAALRRAQSAYDDVKWRNDISALPQSADLEQATNNYEAALARLEDLENGPSGSDISRLQAEVERAQAQLNLLESTLPADVAAAQADVEQAQAQLNLLIAGARPEELAVAEADVAAATANLQQALVGLADLELRAPFAGVVAALDVNVGERVTAGAPVAQLADLSSWEIQTEDLTELDIVGIAPGDEAGITFDAIPDLEITGLVDRIRPIGADQRGDIVYTVVLLPQENDDRLLWNMTSVATFDR